MPKTRTQKEEAVADIKIKLKESPITIIASFAGITMPNLDSFRKKGDEKGVTFTVVKNTLLELAAKAAGIKDLAVRKLGKMLAIVTGGEDEAVAPRLVKDFAKETENKIEIFSGIYEGHVVPVEMVNSLANLPTKEELYAKIVGSIASPARGFASVLKGTISSFYNVIKAIREKAG